MKQVSEAYKTSMALPMRNQSYVRVQIDNANREIIGNGSWSSNGSASISTDDILETDPPFYNHYATLELNWWVLDLSMRIADDTPVDQGFVSSIISDEDGESATSPQLTKTLETPQMLPGLQLSFTESAGEYPSSVTVTCYRDGVIQVQKTVEDISGPSIEVDIQAQEIDQIVIQPGRQLPYRRFRLKHIAYGSEILFDGSEIASIKQSNDVDPLSRRLPQEIMSFSVFDFDGRFDPENPSGKYAWIIENAFVSVQYGYDLGQGAIEWLARDCYLLNGKPIFRKDQANFSATGVIATLTSEFYKDIPGQKSFYSAFKSILEDADLRRTSSVGLPYVIDPSLEYKMLDAPLPVDTHANLLQLLAHASGCWLRTDGENVIHIEPTNIKKSSIYAGTWYDNGHAPYSTWAALNNGRLYPATYATLELNRWVLDETPTVFYAPNTLYSTGFVGNAVSDENGEYSLDPVFGKDFNTAHDFPVLVLEFDSMTGEGPLEINVQYLRGSEIVAEMNGVQVTSSKVTIHCDDALECYGIRITVKKNLPYRRARLTKAYYRETDFILDFSSITEGGQTTTLVDKLKSVDVAVHKYTPKEEKETLYEGSTEDDSILIKFDSPVEVALADISVSNAPQKAASIYSRAVELSNLGDGTHDILITGKRLEDVQEVKAFPVADSGEVDEENNPLVTSQSMAQELAAHISEYLTMRNTYDVAYRGNPELEVGDEIAMQTRFTGQLDCLVLTDEITFNGSLSGKVKVKGLI